MCQQFKRLINVFPVKLRKVLRLDYDNFKYMTHHFSHIITIAVINPADHMAD
jgi:hypothetical protein